MIWSLVKILFFIGIAAALTYGAGLIMETPGEVRIAFGGREVNLSPLGFLIAILAVMLALWVILKVVGLIVAVLRFLTGDQTAITRYFDRNRERRGFDALSQSLIALASGEGRKAQVKAQQAEKLLNRPDLTRLINAQAAEATGNTDRALTYYKEMLAEDATRFVGVQGLLKAKLEAGDTDTALKLAEKAFAIRPKHQGVLDTLFGLQSQRQDWAGARRTLAAKVRSAALPRDVGKRREAVLTLADARAALADGQADRARESAYAANKLSPTFVPAASLAAELHAEAGEGRQAARIVKKAWSDMPHPDLAAAFAAIDPGEAPGARRKRFQTLLRINPDHPETRMVAAELALADEDFPGARRALGDLATTDPSTRSLAIMAAIERGEGSSDQVVRGWLAKALEAPRAPAWVCDKCNNIHGAWTPICDSCESFDTLSWKTPPQSDDSTGAAAMLPLIIGALEKPTPAAEEAAPEVQDAEEPDDAVTEAAAADAETAEDVENEPEVDIVPTPDADDTSSYPNEVEPPRQSQTM